MMTHLFKRVRLPSKIIGSEFFMPGLPIGQPRHQVGHQRSNSWWNGRSSFAKGIIFVTLEVVSWRQRWCRSNTCVFIVIRWMIGFSFSWSWNTFSVIGWRKRSWRDICVHILHCFGQDGPLLWSQKIITKTQSQRSSSSLDWFSNAKRR